MLSYKQRKELMERVKTVSRGDLNEVAQEFGIHPTTITYYRKKLGLPPLTITGARPSNRNGRTAPIRKSTLPDSLARGDKVIITACLEDDNHTGKVGSFQEYNRIAGKYQVILDGGVLCNAVAAHRYDPEAETAKRNPSRRPRASRPFIRWVMEYWAQHPELTAHDLEKTFKRTFSTFYFWKSQIKKDAHGFPLYSKSQSERWEREYLDSKPQPKQDDPWADMGDEVLGQLKTQVYEFTDGNEVLSVTVHATRKSLVVKRLLDGEELPIDGELKTSQAISIAKMIMGAARLAEKIGGASS